MDIFVVDELIGSVLMIIEGVYEFLELEFVNIYWVCFYKNDDIVNGVSMLDMIMLVCYLVGQVVIIDLYVLFVVDIDVNGVVDFVDFNYMGDFMFDCLMVWLNNISWCFILVIYELIDIVVDIFDFIEYEDLFFC